MHDYVHLQRALAAKARNDDQMAMAENLLCSRSYLRATEHFPEDDEKHVWFLDCGLNKLFDVGAPLRTTLPVMKKIRAALPKMQKIWMNSALAKAGRDDRLALVLQAEDEAMDQLQKGSIGMEDIFRPSGASS
ncbi:hypothetical protein HGRIS_003406 [Hohenbuehelia grisea]|uniref:Uncharacterized protein n=1 Tax=Hohenbuehelia grisea TaxID=104357 RepID=A0ABR3JG36_9AGAR